jgi:hypothetical protein
MRRSILSTALAAMTAFAAGHDTVGAQYSRLADDPKAPLYRYGDYRPPQPSHADDAPLGYCHLAQTDAPPRDYCTVQAPRTDAYALYGYTGYPAILEMSIPFEPRSHSCD